MISGQTKIFRTAFFFLLIFSALSLQAQNIKVRDDNTGKEKEEQEIRDSIKIHHMFDVGAGLGLDYGGLGFKLGISPIKRLFIFASGGFNLSAFGWQLGAGFYFIPKDTKHGIRPNIKAMYGTNASILVTDYNGNIVDEYTDVYLGPCVGAGVEFRFGKSKKHGLDADLNVPFRNQKYKDDIDRIKNDPSIEDFQEPLPLQISIGYHFEF